MNDGLRVTNYRDLGVRPLINCVGTVTALSGSLILPQVRQVMAEASTSYVVIAELMEAGEAELVAQRLTAIFGQASGRG